MRTSRSLAILLGCLLLVSCTSTGERALSKVLSDADRLYGEQRFAEAAADYGEYLRRWPSDAVTRIRYGRSLLKSGRPAEAREQLEIAYGVKLNNTEAYEELCEALYEVGAHDDLYRLLRQRTASPGKAEDYARLSRYALRLGDVDEARRALVVASAVDNGRSPAIQLALADFHRSLGDLDEETRRLRMAYSLAPGNLEIQRRLRERGIEPSPSAALVPEEAH